MQWLRGEQTLAQAMRDLIDEIEHAGRPTEDMFFAKVHVLCECFRIM